MTDLRWLAGALFTVIAGAFVYIHCPFSALIPGSVGVYILYSKLRDELK